MEIFTLFIGLIIFLILNNKINKVQENLDQIKQRPYTITQPVASPLPSTSPIISSPATTPSPVQPSGIEQFFQWIAIDWPLKTGAFFIVLGFVWLVSYAFLNNWIGPVGRIVFGLIIGSSTLLLGDRWILKSRQQGVVLVSLGSIIMMITIWASQSFYSMFPPIIALFLGASVMILTAVSSIRHNEKTLITIALIFGGLTPLITGSKDDNNILGLYSFLLVVVSGSLWVVYLKEWRFLTTLSLLLITLYSVRYFFISDFVLESLAPTDLLTLHFFAVTFTSLFYFASVIGVMRKRSVNNPEVITALLVGFYALGWINGITPDYLQSIVALGVSIAFMGASYIAFLLSSKKDAVYMYIASAVVLLIAGTTYAFDGPVLVMALSAQAAILPIVFSKLLNRKVGLSMLLYLVLPLTLSFESFFASSWNSGVFHNDFYSLLAVTLALFIPGLFFYNTHDQDKNIKDISIITIILGSVYGLFLLWKIIHAAIDIPSIAQMFTLTIYIVIGLICYIKGQLENRKVLNRFGLFLTLFVITRLLLVEVWEMVLVWRIVTFFAIGLLLMGSVLLRRR